MKEQEATGGAVAAAAAAYARSSSLSSAAGNPSRMTLEHIQRQAGGWRSRWYTGHPGGLGLRFVDFDSTLTDEVRQVVDELRSTKPSPKTNGVTWHMSSLGKLRQGSPCAYSGKETKGFGG